MKREQCKHELDSIQKDLADYLIGKAAEYSAFTPAWSEDEEGVWAHSGRCTVFDPDAWDAYIDGVAVEY